MDCPDLQMNMHYVSLGKSQLRERVEKLNTIHLLPSSTPGILLEGNTLTLF